MTVEIGEIDPLGERVERLLRRSDAYVIYATPAGVRWLLLGEDAEGRRARLHAISLRLAQDQALAGNALRAADRALAQMEIAAAIAQAFDGDPDGAENRLAALERRLRAGRNGAATLLYAVSAFAASGAIAAAAIALEVQAPTSILGPYAFWAAMGVIGAFLSISIGLEKLSFAAEASRLEIASAPLPRLAIGAISAIAVALALDSGLIARPPAGEGSRFAYALWCLVAGFSETLVPNLLARVERAAEGDARPIARAAPESSRRFSRWAQR